MSTNGDQGKEAAAKKKKDELLARLKEERIPEAVWPTDFGEKKKRPREVAFMDVNLCFPCGKCPEFCPVGCIEYMREGTLSNRGLQPVQVRFEECIGCYICVEICSLLTDYDAVRMYPTDLVEEMFELKIGDQKPAEYHPARPFEEFFAEGGKYSVRMLGSGSRIRDKINKDERKRMGFE
jgi:Pyruvate/2-oxoacid:ferredoxin oxidoreductase delta subunit